MLQSPVSSGVCALMLSVPDPKLNVSQRGILRQRELHKRRQNTPEDLTHYSHLALTLALTKAEF